MKSIILLFVILCIICPIKHITAQFRIDSNNIDSVLRTIEQPDKKVDFILEFLDKPENLYLNNAEVLANRAFEIAQQTHNGEGKIDAMLKLATLFFRKGDYNKSMEYAQNSKTLAEDLNYDKGLANSLSQIGTIYNELGDYDNSANYFFKGLKLFEKIKDKYGISHSLGNIGMDFYNQQDYTKALYYFNKSLTIAYEIHSLSSKKRQLNNIAVVYGSIHQHDTAITFLRKALEINIELGDKLGEGTNIMNIGFGQMNQGKYSDALVSFQHSLDLFTELNNRLHIAECYINIGYCFYLDLKVEESIVYFKKALDEGQQNEHIRIIYSASEILNKIYSDKKDTVNAYKYLIIENMAGDSLHNYQNQKLLSKLELQYIYEKKEFQRQLAQQTKNAVMLIIIFSLISGLIILGLIFSRHRLKSKFVVLEKEKIESELGIKNRELTVNLISLIKKNEMISSISNRLVQLKRNVKGIEAKEIVSLISQELRNSTNDKIFNEFSIRFQEVHAGYYEALLQKYPNLTQNELKLCAFLRLNMSTKDIAEISGQHLPSIDQARYRLRKKLDISNSETNLVTFLSQI